MEQNLSYQKDDYRDSRHLTKITTFRQAREYYTKFQVGEASGIFPDRIGPQPLVITHKKPSSLAESSWIQLATDGWFTPEEAADGKSGLGRFYNNGQDLPLSFRVIAFTYFLKTVFDILPHNQQTTLARLSIDEVATNPRTRILFFRSVCRTAATHNYSASEYIHTLRDRRMLSAVETDVALTNRDFPPDKIGPDELYKMVVGGKNYPGYKRIVLAGLTN